ncbi:MAG: hypothetical protein LC115_13740 [Bacteroidia bacterium]|nr:hypothetical protein [Bacteroidia bacterium]
MNPVFPKLLYFTFLFALTIAAGNYFVYKKSSEVWIWVGAILGIALASCAIYFMASNFGRNVALHRFNFTGFWGIIHVNTTILIVSVVQYFTNRRWFPGLLYTALAVIQYIILGLLWLYYAR